MADFSTKQFQELNEAYVSMYRTEEVVEEVVEATQEEVIEEVEELDENAANRAKQRALRQAQNKDRAQQQLGGIVDALKAKPTGGVGDARRAARGSQYRAPKADAPKADTPAPTPAPEPKADTPKPTPAPEPKAEVKTREIKKPAGGAVRRTPTMGELRAAQAARAAGKSEKDVVRAGVAAGKPKVSARPLPTPPPPVKKSRLDTALSGIGKWSEEKEAYDVVLEYLLSGGHAETVEEAHYVMLEMDTETIKNICEEAQEG